MVIIIMKKVMKILLVLTSITRAITIYDGELGNIPTMVYGGMGSHCNDPAYVNLVAKLKDGLKQPVECYETKILGSIKLQSEAACLAI